MSLALVQNKTISYMQCFFAAFDWQMLSASLIVKKFGLFVRRLCTCVGQFCVSIFYIEHVCRLLWYPTTLLSGVHCHFRLMPIMSISRLRNRNHGLMEGLKTHNCIRGKGLSKIVT
jgi:hypothetical protein